MFEKQKEILDRALTPNTDGITKNAELLYYAGICRNNNAVESTEIKKSSANGKMFSK